MGEKPTEATEQALAPVTTSASEPQTTTATAPAPPEPELIEATDEENPLAEINVSVDPSTGKTSVKFAYICLHCGAPRDVDSGRYIAGCATCGQTAESGNSQLDAVARGEHIPTFDRSSSFFP